MDTQKSTKVLEIKQAANQSAQAGTTSFPEPSGNIASTSSSGISNISEPRPEIIISSPTTTVDSTLSDTTVTQPSKNTT